MAVLHVTNGDAAADDLGVLGEVLPWRDALHEGPVPALGARELREERARFLSSAFGADPQQTRAELEQRDDRLAAVDHFTDVVLWFETDLYDQLQLMQILDRLGGARSRPASIRLAHLPHGPRSHLELRLA